MPACTRACVRASNSSFTPGGCPVVVVVVDVIVVVFRPPPVSFVPTWVVIHYLNLCCPTLTVVLFVQHRVDVAQLFLLLLLLWLLLSLLLLLLLRRLFPASPIVGTTTNEQLQLKTKKKREKKVGREKKGQDETESFYGAFVTELFVMNQQ